jgi:CBS domain-containing protein
MELARNLRKDPVSRLEPSLPRSVDRSATVSDAVELMRRDNTGCILVCENGQLVGLFTERDLMRRVLAVGKPLSLPIAEVMTAEPLTIQSRDPIRLAVRRLEGGGHRHLPIVDDTNRPTGILSVKRVVRYLVEHYPSAVYNQPPKEQAPDSPEGA